MIKTALCFLLFAPALCFAQVTTIDNARGAAKEYYEKADHHYAFGRLEMADSLLHLAVKEKDNFIDAWILMGQINLQFLKHFDVAAKAYEKVKLLKSDYLSDVEFQLAQCYMNQGQYAKARTAFQAFLAQSRINGQSRLLSEKMLKDCDFAEKAMQNRNPSASSR